MTRKRVFYGVLSLLAAVIITAVVYLNSLLPIITGYAAKNLCSAVFVSGRQPAEVEDVDLNFSFIKFNKNEVDYDGKSVTSRFLWGKSKAIFREGFGVTLLREIPEEDLQKMRFPSGTEPGYLQDTIAWPLGDILPDSATGINLQVLSSISQELMSDSGYNGNAFAFLVLHKGIPVMEAYKPHFTKDTKFLSWSMAKSVINALIGIQVMKGNMDINKPAAIAEWSGTEKNAITLNDLMQMQSGLEWNEDYGNRSDVTLMLHCENDMGRFAFEKPLEHPVGYHWYYSSGTTNIVSNLLRYQFTNDSLYYSSLYTDLFNKTGMTNIVFEVDPSGTIVGSSYLYATARDYARFALLYENDGIFNGDRILPEGWVDYSRSATIASNGAYGSFWWLNGSRAIPSAPKDMYYCVGHDGQRIFILPTEELIVVVLGYSPSTNGGMDFDSLLKDIISAL